MTDKLETNGDKGGFSGAVRKAKDNKVGLIIIVVVVAAVLYGVLFAQ